MTIVLKFKKINYIDQKIKSVLAMFWNFFQNKIFLKIFYFYNISKINSYLTNYGQNAYLWTF
jgi:hypothetical protein